jgi:hypothetical protein
MSMEPSESFVEEPLRLADLLEIGIERRIGLRGICASSVFIDT